MGLFFQLADSFEQYHSYGRCEVQAPCSRFHRDRETGVGLSIEQTLRKPPRFSAKNKIIVRLELSVPVIALGFSRKQQTAGWGTRGRFECVQVFPILQIHLMPIIHACTTKLTIVYREAERFDQMQPASGCQAEPCHVPGIWRNLWFNEHNVKHVSVKQKKRLNYRGAFSVGRESSYRISYSSLPAPLRLARH